MSEREQHLARMYVEAINHEENVQINYFSAGDRIAGDDFKVFYDELTENGTNKEAVNFVNKVFVKTETTYDDDGNKSEEKYFDAKTLLNYRGGAVTIADGKGAKVFMMENTSAQHPQRLLFRDVEDNKTKQF